MANTHQVLQGVKDYTLELIGEEYRDVAVDAADRAEAQAERAEAAADNAEIGIRDDTVTKQHLTPGLREELDGKADRTEVPTTAADVGAHPDTWRPSTSDLTDYPGHTVLLGAGSYGKIPVREPDSDDIRVSATPKERYHAAAKEYVDSRIRLVTAWPASPVAGVLYLMEE